MKTRVTMTLDNAVLEKLPKYGKSGTVNEILKQHFQKEGADKLYELFKHRLLRDKEISEWIEFTVREVR